MSEHTSFNKALPPSGAAAYIFGDGGARGTQRLAKLRVTGGGPTFFRVGRSIFYRIDDLDAYMLANSRRSTSDSGSVDARAA